MCNDNKRFNEKIAVITGGTSGMGRAIAEKLSAEGARVFIIGRNTERGFALETKINKSHLDQRAYFIKYDLLDLENMSVIKDRIFSEGYNAIDVLVNAAGTWDTPALEEITVEQYRKTFDGNFAAAMFLIQELHPMLKKNKGNIVNISSIGGLQSHIAGRRQYLYGAAKAAMIQFSQLCSLNFAPDVRVNCICPGITDTPIFTNRDFSRFSNIPLKRIGKVEGVADLVAFVASDMADYMTGAVITLDGGGSLL